jgi:hypothetical protein
VLRVDRRRGPFKDSLVLFPTAEEVERLVAGCGPTELVRVRHALGSTVPSGAAARGDSATSCIDLTRTMDDVYQDMDPKSCRYEVRRAAKLGDRLTMTRGGDRGRADFFRLYNEFVTWKGYAKPMTRRRYEEYLTVSDVLVAYVDDVPVAAHLIGVDDHAWRVRLLFSASARFADGDLGRLASPVNRWLHWQEMQLYASDGVAVYDFGGGTSKSSIGRFKLSFGGRAESGSDMVVAGALVRAPLRVFDGIAAARGDLRRRARSASR